MSGDPLRAAVERAARELQNLVSKYTRALGENGDRVADLLSGDAYRIGSELKDALAEHPAPEPPNECATPTCPTCYPAGGEVTADEIYDVLHQSWLASPEFLPDHRAAADAILARFHVNPRADA